MQSSSRDHSKKRSRPKTIDDHQLEIIDSVIENSKYGRYDDDGDGDDNNNDIMTQLYEWSKNGCNIFANNYHHSATTKSNATQRNGIGVGQSLEHRRRALSINCNLELNSPINKTIAKGINRRCEAVYDFDHFDRNANRIDESTQTKVVKLLQNRSTSIVNRNTFRFDRIEFGFRRRRHTTTVIDDTYC